MEAKGKTEIGYTAESRLEANLNPQAKHVFSWLEIIQNSHCVCIIIIIASHFPEVRSLNWIQKNLQVYNYSMASQASVWFYCEQKPAS